MSELEPKQIFGPDSGSFKNGDLSGKFSYNWVEENVVFTKRIGRHAPSPKSNSHLGSNFGDKISHRFFIFLSIVFSLVVLRIFYLQIIKGQEYRNLAERNRQRIIPIVSERGIIYDRNNIALTENIPSFSLAIVPQDLPRKKTEREPVIKKLAELSGQNEDDIRKTIEDYSAYSYESIVIQENINYDTALKLLIAASDLPGIQIQRGSKRFYKNYNQISATSSSTAPSSLSHVFGYIGKLNTTELESLYNNGYYPSDSIGKTGVEKSYESVLRGTYGRKRIEVNSAGKEQSVLAEEAPIPGKHLKLAIDLEIQKKLEEIIKNSLARNQKERASAVVMDPNNGEILALVNYPTFDSNDFSGGISYEKYQNYISNSNRPLFNRAVSGLYPSGSVIKPAIAAAVLQEGIIDASTSFLSNGGLQVGVWYFPDWKPGGHGITNVRKALAWSVNTFFYYVGGGYKNFVGIGADKITEYLKKFGFSSELGVDLPGESAGFLPTTSWKKEKKNEQWYVGDTYNYSIGQGDILVTPLQIAAMTSAVANGGILYAPHVVKATVDPVSKKEKSVEPKIINQNFISSNHLETIRLGMRDCVVYGSCRQLNNLSILAAGKTGTAQWNKNKANHAWFTSFAPYDNPKIVITVMVEEGGEGSGISAPIAYEFYKWWTWYIKKS